ncbi:D-alanyl-lipoteichoic acid biosynthesis protein DltB [Miniphocaeibacter halophilus]|uniref:D-alanyl-lipoteichoic acid biosynthesis protein DltB n=1 Tax=Miniphocaeibacter halophilus TaxID=2931922 RepID=A0AC61MN41_9FIRM|nr:D-alanyl-lipoteichoic acid biosynthesis protein DltB [Miniphocaeibacter halophilus]QQK07032.1 D-alanyl-lipoteichoic acid biosynthesis protein DltB [Miniphocaeibacter halophilus]
MITQFGDLFSLYVYFILLLPAIILGILGKKIKYYGFIVSIPCLFLIFVDNMNLSWNIKIYINLIQFILYLVYQFALIIFFTNYWKNNKNKYVYYIVLVLSILPLFLVKLSPHVKMPPIGFIGISYLSFRIWQIIIDTKDGNFKHKNILDIFYFITFFPTISAGPIDRQRRFFKEINSDINNIDYINNYLIDGFKKIVLGILYKFAIASFINERILENLHYLPKNYAFLATIIYMYAYTLYLFFDFAGYTNFAIGTSYFLGVKPPENFKKPFLAKNMKEFWNRWHISLSKWFSDYIFSRFLLNNLRNGNFKSRKLATRVAFLITMGTMGIWHGFELHYILYGLYQGILLVITDIYLSSKIYKNFKTKKLYAPISIIVCFQFIAFGMLLFSGYLFK